MGAGLNSAHNQIGTAIRRNDAALEKARTGIIDSIGAYYSLKAAIGAPVRAAAEFETVLEDIGQKSDVPVEKLGELGDKIKQVARDTNQGAMQIGAAVDALAGRGADLDVALTAADPIGRAAVAYRAATDDLAAASWAAVDNLKVPASQIEIALDAMAQAGKDGAFELRDMATYFPSLGAAYQGLGQQGVGAVADLASALQVVRKGTGDASTAATNLQNVLQKIYAPATVKKFGDAGVDIFKEMDAAAKRGLTPIEAIAEITDRTLNGDLSKMGNLFEDAQVQAGLRSLIQGMEEYRDIRAKAMSAEGVLDADYERRIRTAQGAQDRWNASVQDLNITFGTALLPVLNDLLDGIVPVIGAVGEWTAANPKLAAGLATVVGGLIAFRGALAALRFVGLLGKGGALSSISFGLKAVSLSVSPVVAGLGKIRASMMAFSAVTAIGGPGAALSMIGRAALGLLNPLRLVSLAIRGVGMAFAMNPIGASVAAIGAAVYLLYRNWAGFKEWFGRLWGSVKTYFTGFGNFVAGVFTLDLGRALGGIKDMWDGAIGFFKTVLEGIGGIFTATWTDIIAPILDQFGLLDPIKTAWEGLKSFFAPTLTFISDKFTAAWRVIKPIIDGLTWVVNNGAKVEEAVGRFGDRASGFFTGRREGETAEEEWQRRVHGAPQARAVGGSFRPGPLVVGERGAEALFANRGGFIATNRQLNRMAGAVAQIGALGAALGATPAAALPLDDILPGNQRGAAIATAPAIPTQPQISVGGITIISSPGQSPRQIADEVLRELDRRARGALYDVGGF
ncbi:phage tail tape measure protein [Paracoccus aestuariivivens]|uniref:phage tail tape measure protein n=1 Tax=Paracoccus aestuariivivens TaxID=1820333 RepID=UPI0014796A93